MGWVDQALTLVFAIATPLLLYLVKRGIAWLEAEHKLKVDKETEARLEALIRNAINYAEEQARKQAKGEAAGKPASQSKLSSAIGYIEAEADSPIEVDRAARLVEARLASMRPKE